MSEGTPTGATLGQAGEVRGSAAGYYSNPVLTTAAAADKVAPFDSGVRALQGRSNTFIAREGLPFIAAVAVAVWATAYYLGIAWAAAPAAVLVVVYLVFRDPRRAVPSVPLGVVSPVDGRIKSVELADKGVLQGEAHVIRIWIDALGTYTARCPVEGKIMDIGTAAAQRVTDYRTNALWVRTDENDDVVLQFGGYRFGLAPRSFIRFGERLGQGQRCAYLRLARYAEVHLPTDSKVLAEPGQRVEAGADLIAKLPHP